MSFQEWKSVVVSGRYEELPETEDFFSARATAHWLLSEHAAWWEPGYVKTLHDGVERPMESVWFRIQIQSITGHEAVPDTLAPPTLESAGFNLGRGFGRLMAWGRRRPAQWRPGCGRLTASTRRISGWRIKSIFWDWRCRRDCIICVQATT